MIFCLQMSRSVRQRPRNVPSKRPLWQGFMVHSQHRRHSPVTATAAHGRWMRSLPSVTWRQRIELERFFSVSSPGCLLSFWLFEVLFHLVSTLDFFQSLSYASFDTFRFLRGKGIMWPFWNLDMANPGGQRFDQGQAFHFVGFLLSNDVLSLAVMFYGVK